MPVPNTFTVPNPDCAFMGVEYVCVAFGCEKKPGIGYGSCAYGVLDTCCTSSLVGEATLKHLLSYGLEFHPTGDVKFFKGIGPDLIQSVDAGHIRCQVAGGGRLC